MVFVQIGKSWLLYLLNTQLIMLKTVRKDAATVHLTLIEVLRRMNRRLKANQTLISIFSSQESSNPCRNKPLKEMSQWSS